MKDIEHRRRARRYPLRWSAAVVFERPPGKPVVHTQTQDLSGIGAAILSDHGDLTGAEVTLLLAYQARKSGAGPQILKVRARIVSTVRTPGMAQYRHGLSFIRSPEDSVDALEEILRAGAAQETVAAEVATGGRLEQFRQQAQAKLAEAPVPDPRGKSNALVSDALEKTYRYLKELAEQFNILHPPFPKGYAIIGVPEFGGLAWDEGHAGFHTRETSATVRLYREVSLRFRLSARKQIRLTREFPASEKLKQLLEDSRIEYSALDTRNERGSIARTAFDFRCEVKASVLLLGQFDTGKLLLRTRNVCGFGSLEQIIAPEAVSADSLDELGVFILGEAARLGPLLLRGA